MVPGHTQDRIIAVEEHFITPDYFSRVDELVVFPGEQAELAFMNGFRSNPAKFRNHHQRNGRHKRACFCIGKMGVENIMFAIDYPYEDSATATDFLHRAELDDRQRALISHRNAERLFRVPPVAASTDE